jgi:quinol monooxygenase YgiN
MRRFFSLIVLMGIAATGICARDGKQLYAVTHVDIAGRGEVLDQATNLIRQFAADSRNDAGVVRFEILQQDGHPNHFTVFEVWESRQAFEAHLAAQHTRQFREKLQPMIGSPFRESLLRLM